MKKMQTVEEQLKKYKKRFYVLLTVSALITALFGFYIFLNYDYLAFKHFITGHYIYTDALDKLFKKELNRDVKGNYYSYFDDLAIAAVTKQIRETNNDRYTYLYIPEQYRKYLQEEKDEAGQSETKIINDKTIYLHITNFSKYTQKFLQDNTAQLKKYPYIIIDLRDNLGGDIDAMCEMSGLFLPKGSIIATDKMRLFNWTYKARKNQELNFQKIIILQNQNTASASENFVAALKDNLRNVLLIGGKTYGKGIGQFTLPLRRGFAVKATILQWFTPKDVNIQGNGIEPDIPYNKDDILQFAVRKLSE